MKHEFEFQAFDRVTFYRDSENLKGVYYASSISEAKGIAGGCYLFQSESIDGLMPISAPPESITPGHYDKDGNWLPQPGEPCHIILANGSPKNMVVVSAEEYCVTAIGEYDTERTIYIKTSLGFVDGDWYFDMAESDAIPQSAVLFPGRIKAPQQ